MLTKTAAIGKSGIEGGAVVTVHAMRMRSAGLMIIAVVLPAAALLGAFFVFMRLVSDFDRVGDSPAAYVKGKAILRTCPSRACEATVTYEDGQQVLIVSTVTGEKVDGVDKWYEVEFGAGTRFVYAPKLTTPSGAAVVKLELVVASASFLFVVLMWIAPRWKGLVAGESASRIDQALFGLVVAVGLAAGTVGFVLSRWDGQSPTAFLSGTFVNLGSGLVGAAIAFVLFQSLLSDRSVGPRQLAELNARMKDLEVEVVAAIRDLHVEVEKLGADREDHRNRFSLSTLLRRFMGQSPR